MGTRRHGRRRSAGEPRPKPSCSTAWEQTQQQLAAATDRAAKAQQAESALKQANDELQARLAAALAAPGRSVDGPTTADAADIEQVLRQFQAAYERVDAAAVVKLWPSAPGRTHGQFLARPVVHSMPVDPSGRWRVGRWLLV
jgi:hypothetical protein